MRRARLLALALLATTLAYVATGSSCRSATPAGGAPRVTPAPPQPATSPSTGTASPAAGLVKPTLRVGLTTTAARASIGADGGVVVEGVAARSTVSRATLVPSGAAAEGRRFRVQVASLGDEAAARQVARLAEDAVGSAAVVRWNAETRTFQVRVGEYATREQAQAATAGLRRAGLSGSFVADDGAPGSGGRIRLLETGQEVESVLVRPVRAADVLDLDGAPYRGWLEVRANPAGALTVVNVVNLEDYLRGVVPNELSPVAYPQLEALKAQAVAARTYALRNLGQYASQGYDLCATPACQVYRGKGTEHPLSDQAVSDTDGLAATWQGRYINAMYTSTCGGSTEDSDNMFEGESHPYLKGVACLPEGSAFSTLSTRASPRGPGAARDLALLVALGVLDERRAAGPMDGPAREGEVRAWTARLLTALRRRACSVASDEALVQRGAFYHYLVGSLCWEERAARLLAPGDADYLLKVEDRHELVAQPVRLAVALLLQEGVVSPFPDNTVRLLGTATRAEVVDVLARIAAKAGAPDWITGRFRSAQAGQVEIEVGDEAVSYPLDPGLRLYRDLDGSRAAVSELGLVAGDTVSVVVREGRVAFLEARQSRLGPSADRSSRYYRWEVRTSPEELTRGAAAQARIGKVLDVEPRRLGVSGRVVELAVVGEAGEILLKGLRIRSFLGLRENLFVVDRERDARGGVRRFVFTGKGWGHGVGLCQVGAFGMAQAGGTYEQILKHYYTGIRLARAH